MILDENKYTNDALTLAFTSDSKFSNEKDPVYVEYEGFGAANRTNGSELTMRLSIFIDNLCTKCLNKITTTLERQFNVVLPDNVAIIPPGKVKISESTEKLTSYDIIQFYTKREQINPNQFTTTAPSQIRE
ncbi:hypothetical protein ACOME3_010705 [Neoechinorhynchus agilis]